MCQGDKDRNVSELAIHVNPLCRMFTGRKRASKPSQRWILTINAGHEHEHRDDNGVERDDVPESQLQNTSHWSRKRGYYDENGIQDVK
jgi:hypothetical protein